MKVDADTATEYLLRVLGDPVRWRIAALLGAEELCVCHLVEELDQPQPLVSHHLRVLREAGVVTSERFRQWTYYRLTPEPLRLVSSALAGLTKAASRSAPPRRPCL